MKSRVSKRFNDLAGILNTADELLKENESTALAHAGDIIRRVYETRTGDYIERLQNMLCELARQAEDGSLYERLPGVILELTRDNEQLSADKTGYLPITEAVEQWYAHDRKAGRRPISPSGYRFRIKNAAENGKINVNVVSPRNHIVSKAEFNGLIKSYDVRNAAP